MATPAEQMTEKKERRSSPQSSGSKKWVLILNESDLADALILSDFVVCRSDDERIFSMLFLDLFQVWVVHINLVRSFLFSAVAKSLGSLKTPKIDLFPNSTLRGNEELGNNNQVAVALVIYLLARDK